MLFKLFIKIAYIILNKYSDSDSDSDSITTSPILPKSPPPMFEHGFTSKIAISQCSCWLGGSAPWAFASAIQSLLSTLVAQKVTL